MTSFNLRSSVLKVAHIRPLLTGTLCVASSQALSSAIVASGQVATCGTDRRVQMRQLWLQVTALSQRSRATASPPAAEQLGDVGDAHAQQNRILTHPFAVIRRRENAFPQIL